MYGIAERTGKAWKEGQFNNDKTAATGQKSQDSKDKLPGLVIMYKVAERTASAWEKGQCNNDKTARTRQKEQDSKDKAERQGSQ
jgi:hypothetical protein